MPLHFLDIHALQRLCRAGFNTGRSRLPMPAQIALNRPRLFARRNDLHRTKRASQHTAFTANATCLFNENMPMFAAYRVNRADIRARCIFTLMTGYCRGPAVVFNDTNTGICRCSHTCRICRARASVTAIIPVCGGSVCSQSASRFCACCQFSGAVSNP